MTWFGAAFIVFSSAFIGMELARRLERRTTLLRHVKVALETFDTEVAFAMMPLAQALEQVSRQLPSPTKEFFHQVAVRLTEVETSAVEVWEEELDVWKVHVDLEEKDIEILRQFGQTLGKQDIDGQRKQIQLTQSYLNHMENMAQDAQKKYQSMYRSLGFLGGLLLVIMLL
ncbi:stage III sporulation protein SpoIIIAB [Salipaludibacillus daqingensis]|uniref:stage III sporulation protein SpoIIIAB n=1 Tax=Salipaludibacillus daqingensis TaxID=3041001 RepID=UPI0024756E50|nr:stage III sporulation protein SpoIIIAB [Salipaludibacillus daqingensis]